MFSLIYLKSIYREGAASSPLRLEFQRKQQRPLSLKGFLFSEMEPTSPSENTTTVPTWVLLYHVDSTRAEMRMELALPVHIDVENSRVDQWKTRIKLAPVKFDHRPAIATSEPGVEFNIEIRRKENE